MITIEDIREADGILLKDDVATHNIWLNRAVLTRDMYECVADKYIAVKKDFKGEKRGLFLSIDNIQEVYRNNKIYGRYYL